VSLYALIQWPFIVTALVSVFIGVLTISIKTYSAARENPSDVLKATLLMRNCVVEMIANWRL